MKKCKTCLIYKNTSDFPLNKTYSSGYSNSCKACKASWNKKNYYRYRAKKKIYSKIYRVKNSEKIKQYRSRYYLKNIDKIKKYRATRKEINRKYMANYLKSNRWYVSYNAARARCTKSGHPHYKKNNIKFKMTPTQFKMLWFRDMAFKMNRPSIDRINPKGDYVLDNCRFIEFSENMRRRCFVL